MIELGKWQTLSVVRSKEFGVYLNEKGGAEEAILLPRKQVPEDTKAGDELRVFVYKDSEDRLIATMMEPYITLGELAILKVVSTSTIGAFMDWGLAKDILLPFKEQMGKVEEGKSYLVKMYIDKSSRLCVTMKVYEDLLCDSTYAKDDNFTGVVIDYKEELGAFIAVDNKYSGLIPQKELFKKLFIGDKVEGRITNVREDGKLDLSIRRPAYMQMDEDSQIVYKKIESYRGELPFTDKTDPETIKSELGLSKAAFKRAVGKLLKEKKIEITDKSIKII